MKDLAHYFDWAATSPADEDILKAALDETLECWGNPSSTHAVGKQARELYYSFIYQERLKFLYHQIL